MGFRSSVGNCFANCFRVLVVLLNAIVLSGAIATVALVFVIRPNPTPAGWGFIVVGIVTLLSGLLGAIFAGKFGCCGFHVFLHAISIAGTASIGIICLVKPQTISDALVPTIELSQANEFIYVVGGINLALLLLQIILIILLCCAESCGCLDRNYDDLSQVTAKEVAKQQMEEEERRGRIESTSAHQLAQKMKEKYGKFSLDKK